MNRFLRTPWYTRRGLYYFFLVFLLFNFTLNLKIFGENTIQSSLFKEFIYRNLGPFRTGSWISDITAPQSKELKYKRTFYVAARNGGVWKTVNNGTTFFPIFDLYGTNAIGAIEVAPSDPEILWVGTGEDSNARSAYAGNGIYKSTDGGKNFKNMGLKDSHHIGKIVIHPSNPDIVYVAVMGHLFSNNEERGIFKTNNGGKTWEKIFYIDDQTGMVDLCMNPENPQILFAASYDKQRTPWHFEAGGEKSRIYRTENGGTTWKQLKTGLPQGKLGRIGIDIFRKNPSIIYSVIQNLNPKPDLIDATNKKFDEFADHSYDHLIGGEVYRSNDGGDHWQKISAPNVNVSDKAAYSFNEITVDPFDSNNVYIIGVYMKYSRDGGKTWPKWPDKKRFLKNFGDVRTFWIDPLDPNHMMLGSDGGIYISWDGGLTTDFRYNIPLGEVYAVETDNSTPYNLYIGLQDHEIWKGPSNGWSGSIGLEDWIIVGLWDGMYSQVNPDNNRWLYFTSQFGKHHRVDQQKGERQEITPKPPLNNPPYRFTWTTPLVLSPHNGDILYTGGQMLLRSMNRGISWQEISPDLTSNDPIKIAGEGHMMFCTITTISESPLEPGIIWVGTDDGKVHLTKNHGANWQEMTEKIHQAGGSGELWVSRVFASNHNPNIAYVVKSGYRQDIFKPFVFLTTDMGSSWENISGNLPAAPISVIIEDSTNPNLLFVGTDKGVYFTLDQGKNWNPFINNMPPVPIRDLLIQEKSKDLIVGTYGRGVWIVNISPLQEINKKILAKDFYLFDINEGTVMNYSQRANWGNYHMTGDSHIRTPNEKSGLKIYYYQNKKISHPLYLKIKDIDGNELTQEKLKKQPGIHLYTWNSPTRTPGIYIFILSDGKTQIVKKGALKPRIYWPTF